MRERLIDIKTADGMMETFITHPEENGPFPAVLLYMDIWGVREELYDLARRIGTVGYYCVVPDLYYRQGKVRFEFRNDKHQVITGARLDEETRRLVREQMELLTNSMVMEDTAAILTFIKAGEPVRAGGMGTIGYCMGGRHVLCAAGVYPEHFIASAAIHGTRMLGDNDKHGSAPLRLAHKFRGELYCGFAEHDQHMSIPQIQEMADTMKPCPVRYRFAMHAGAIHGYALPQRDVYNKQATERDWENIFAMFHRQIPPYTA